ncbi:MAG TPA: hypothetical protein VF698_14555, partial [Thermoanaerobaculia bacterium]
MNRALIRTITAAALVATTAFPAAAQRQPAQPAPAEDNQKLMEVIDVRVINVDVVVTDRKGNPITGLTKDDFEILENGVPKVITNFYEVEGNRAKNAVLDVVEKQA